MLCWGSNTGLIGRWMLVYLVLGIEDLVRWCVFWCLGMGISTFSDTIIGPAGNGVWTPSHNGLNLYREFANMFHFQIFVRCHIVLLHSIFFAFGHVGLVALHILFFLLLLLQCSPSNMERKRCIGSGQPFIDDFVCMILLNAIMLSELVGSNPWWCAFLHTHSFVSLMECDKLLQHLQVCSLLSGAAWKGEHFHEQQSAFEQQWWLKCCFCN